jgi:signal transduction histidine kinase
MSTKAFQIELSKKNIKLSEAYSKLIEHANVGEELSDRGERNRMAGESHDSVGHCLSVLVAMLEVVKMTISKQLCPCRAVSRVG